VYATLIKNQIVLEKGGIMNMGVLVLAVVAAFGVLGGMAILFLQKLREKQITAYPVYSTITFLSLITAGALYGVWYGCTGGYSFISIAATFFMTIYTGLGVSLGLHRHDTHKSFKMDPVVECILAVGAWMAGMHKRSWVPNHHQHHAYEDKFDDPHSPKLFDGRWYGFFWSHIGWLFVQREYSPSVQRMDTARIPFIRSERFLFAPCFVLGFIIPYVFFGQAGVWLAFIRVTYVLNMAFSINSAGHMFGTAVRQESFSRNGSWFGALLTMVGERYHAFHHADPRSAYLGWRWWDIDVGKWVLRSLELMGLVWDVRRPKIYQRLS